MSLRTILSIPSCGLHTQDAAADLGFCGQVSKIPTTREITEFQVFGAGMLRTPKAHRKALDTRVPIDDVLEGRFVPDQYIYQGFGPCSDDLKREIRRATNVARRNWQVNEKTARIRAAAGLDTGLEEKDPITLSSSVTLGDFFLKEGVRFTGKGRKAKKVQVRRPAPITDVPKYKPMMPVMGVIEPAGYGRVVRVSTTVTKIAEVTVKKHLVRIENTCVVKVEGAAETLAEPVSCSMNNETNGLELVQNASSQAQLPGPEGPPLNSGGQDLATSVGQTQLLGGNRRPISSILRALRYMNVQEILCRYGQLSITKRTYLRGRTLQLAINVANKSPRLRCINTPLAFININSYIAFELTNKGMHAKNGNTTTSGSAPVDLYRPGSLPGFNPGLGAPSLPTNLPIIDEPDENSPPEISSVSQTMAPFIPSIGLTMLPTQLGVGGRSPDIDHTWGDDMFPNDDLAFYELTFTPGGNRRIEQNPIRLEHYDPITKIETPFTLKSEVVAFRDAGVIPVKVARLYDGHAHNMNVQLPGELIDAFNSPHNHYSLRTIVGKLLPRRQVGESIVARNPLGATERINRYNDMKQILDIDPGLSYINFFLKGWLDFLTMTAIKASGVGNWQFLGNIGPAGPGGYPWPARVHIADIGVTRIAAVAMPGGGWVGAQGRGDQGGERCIWDQLHSFADGSSFLCDIAQYDSNYAKFVVRYAGSYPTEEIIRPADNHHPIAQLIDIPGANDVIFHTGNMILANDDMMAYGPGIVGGANALLSGFIEPKNILAFMNRFAASTGSQSDLRQAFEMASSIAFGVYGDDYGTGLVGARLGRVNTVYDSHLNDNGEIRVPRDRTLMEYFRPEIKAPDRVADIGRLMRRRIYEVYHIAVDLFEMHLVARQWALIACNITSIVYENRNTVTDVRYAYAQKVFSRGRGVGLSLYDGAVQNCCAYMYRWAPSEITILMHNPLLPSIATRCMSACYSFASIPQFVNAYCTIDHAYAFPDVFVVPTKETAIKWDEKIHKQVRNRRGASVKARLANAMEPIDDKWWMGDGGAVFSAQHYISINGQDPRQAAITRGTLTAGALQPQNVVINGWNSPWQFNEPAGVAAKVIVRYPHATTARPFANYMVPGQMTNYDHVEEELLAYSVVAFTHNDWMTRISLQEPGLVPGIHYRSAFRHKFHASPQDDFAVYALRDRLTRRILGMTLISMNQTAGQPHEEGAAPEVVIRKGITGGAHHANDPAPQLTSASYAAIARLGARNAPQRYERQTLLYKDLAPKGFTARPPKLKARYTKEAPVPHPASNRFAPDVPLRKAPASNPRSNKAPTSKEEAERLVPQGRAPFAGRSIPYKDQNQREPPKRGRSLDSKKPRTTKPSRPNQNRPAKSSDNALYRDRDNNFYVTMEEGRYVTYDNNGRLLKELKYETVPASLGTNDVIVNMRPDSKYFTKTIAEQMSIQNRHYNDPQPTNEPEKDPYTESSDSQALKTQEEAERSGVLLEPLYSKVVNPEEYHGQSHDFSRGMDEAYDYLQPSVN